jgi:hypothetical protein
MKNLKIFTIVLAFVLALSITAFGQTITSTTTGGNWNAGGTWVGGVVPGASNDVIIADGATVTINAAVSVASVTVGQGTSGILTFDGVAARAVTVSGNVTISAGGTFITQTIGTFTNTLSIGGDLTNNGTFDMSQAGTTLLCTVIFNKVGDQLVTGTTPTLTRFRSITLDKTSVNNKVICNIDVSDAGASPGAITFTNGTWEQTANTFTVSTGSQTIGANGAWVFSGSGSLNMGVAASIVVTGTLTVNTSGTFTMGSGNNSITTTGTPTINFTSGTVTIYGRLTLTLGTTTINGANIFIDPQHTNNLANSSNCFEVAAAANFYFSSGSVTIIDPVTGATGGSGREIRLRLATTGTHSVTNGIFYLGDGVSTTTTTAEGFRISVDATNPVLRNLVIRTGGADGQPIASRVTTISTNNTLINGKLTMISGGFTGSNIFNFGASGTLSYEGLITQTTTGTEFPALNGPANLTINNSSGVTLHASRTVNGTLTLTAGNISTSSNTLAIGSAGTVSRTSGYVIGNLQQTFSSTGSKKFDVGTANGYSPVTVDATAGTGNFTVKAIQGAHPQAYNADVLQRYWTLTNADITSADLTFEYLAGDVVGTETNYIIGRFSDPDWFFPGGSVNPTTHTASITGVTSFSDWTMGEQGSLPVQLASFVGNVVGNNAQLEWQTISEINNYGFNVQRYDAISKSYNNVGFVAGKGIPYTYTYEDKNVSGSLEYRLEQIDNNGLTSYFGPIMLNPNSVGSDAVPAVFALNQNYPNPFNPLTIINYQLAIDNYTTLKVYNLIGKEVATLVNGNQSAGSHQVTFDGSALTSGVYFYKLQSGSNVEVKKLTLVK